jgi:hypothetical protein
MDELAEFSVAPTEFPKRAKDTLEFLESVTWSTYPPNRRSMVR